VLLYLKHDAGAIKARSPVSKDQDGGEDHMVMMVIVTTMVW
jgi:hypothetical protein